MAESLPHSTRLVLREMTNEDYPALCTMLHDDTVMHAYGGAFNEAESQAWLAQRLQGYTNDGFNLWAITLRDSNIMIGQCGITWQSWQNRRVLEVGYLLAKDYQRQGFASEAATAARDYAFYTMDAQEVFAIIRAGNHPSMRVAARLGMRQRGTCVKHYRNIVMPHLVFSVLRSD